MMARVLKRFGFMIAGLALACGLAALFGSFIPSNRRWIEPNDGVTIYVATNGYHTGLLLPTSADGVDLSMAFRPTDLPDPRDSGDYLLFGWGDRDFFLNTPTWADVRPRTLVVALIGSGGSLLHVDHVHSPAEIAGARTVRLTSAEYRVLVAEIRRFAKLSSDGHPISTPGYGPRDVFYDATGRYSAVTTCNVWTADRLRATGVRVGLWTPFSGGVMHWFSR